jgi:hypothetical protein
VGTVKNPEPSERSLARIVRSSEEGSQGARWPAARGGVSARKGPGPSGLGPHQLPQPAPSSVLSRLLLRRCSSREFSVVRDLTSARTPANL